MKLEFGAETKLNEILEKIQSSTESRLDVEIPQDSLLLANSVNKEIIKRFAMDVGKEVNFTSIPAEIPISDELGFVEGQDVATLDSQSPAEAPLPQIAPQEEVAEGKKFVALKIPNLTGLRKIPKLWWATGGVVATLVAAFFIFAWWLPAAEVVLTYEGQTKDSSSEIEVIVGGAFDESKKQIPATTEELIKNDLATAKATGKKNVGNPAKGRITVYNYSESDRVFTKGTIVTSTKGVTFTLDDERSATASAGFGTFTQVGVNVTATKSGPEGNLPAQTNFTVGSASPGEVYAKNDTPFTGGSIKTITVVSEADRKSLKTDLVKKLTEAATEEIRTNNASAIIPEDGVEISVSKETYDAEIGQEASEVSLSLEVTAKAIVLKAEDLIAILTKTMTIPAGFRVSESESTTSATLTKKTTDSNYQLQGKIGAVLVPDVDLNEVKKNLSAKTTGAAKSYLDSLEGIKGYTIKLKPSFYSGIGWLPFSTSKIDVRLEKEE